MYWSLDNRVEVVAITLLPTSIQSQSLENFLNVPKQVQEGLPWVSVSLTLSSKGEIRQSPSCPNAHILLCYGKTQSKQIKVQYFKFFYQS